MYKKILHLPTGQYVCKKSDETYFCYWLEDRYTQAYCEDYTILFSDLPINFHSLLHDIRSDLGYLPDITEFEIIYV